MTPGRTLRFALAAVLLTGITGFATPASAGPARPARTTRPLAIAALTGATALTLSNGTRVALDAPWAATNTAGRFRGFMTTGLDFACIFGAEEAPAPQAAPAQPDGAKYTLTIRARDLSGAPDTGDQVQVFSATSMNWNKYHIERPRIFRHGLITMHVPAGKYWLIGLFTTRHSLRMDIPAQVPVTGDTTATVSAHAASSEVSATTPRPAGPTDSMFSSSYPLRGGQTFMDCGTTGGSRLWVSPLAHTTGTLSSATAMQLNSPPGQAAYTYELDSAAPPSTIASQHLTVTAADLATVHERFHSDTATTAEWLALGGPPRQWYRTGFFAISTLLPMPGSRTVYFQAQPTAVWRPRIFGPLAELPVWQVFHAGQALSTDWNAYPLHPAPNQPPAGLPEPTFVSASRTGNLLRIDLTPFSDNTRGHTGSGLSLMDSITGRASWAIDANGVKIASGKLRSPVPFPDIGASATLSPKPSKIEFTLTVTRKGAGSDLSGTSTDTWTWPSRAEPHATVPAPWYCGATFTHGRIVYDRHCAVQDMMTLDYHLAREGLDGTAPAGRQSLGIAIGHLPESTPYPVTHARLQVSFGNGTRWRPATVTRICHGQICTNAYRASYTAPAGAQVSLRLTARDTHGATVTETILDAYQTA
jgi:hypothetical protein